MYIYTGAIRSQDTAISTSLIIFSFFELLSGIYFLSSRSTITSSSFPITLDIE